ncbi:ABC transporter ced-7 [Aphelenchoides besseyi]|nr:ABC transporter ced-7 [Aphelenchoides besseyi]
MSDEDFEIFKKSADELDINIARNGTSIHYFYVCETEYGDSLFPGIMSSGWLSNNPFDTESFIYTIDSYQYSFPKDLFTYQRTIDAILLNIKGIKSTDTLNFDYIPTKGYKWSGYNAALPYLAVLIISAALIPMGTISKDVITEVEADIKVYLLIMGMNRFSFYFSHLINGCIKMWIVIITAVTYSLFWTTMFRKPGLCITFIIISAILLTVFSFVSPQNRLDIGMMCVSSLNPVFALKAGLHDLRFYDRHGMFPWPGNRMGYQFNIFFAFLFLIIDTVIIVLLTFLLDTVLPSPGQTGINLNIFKKRKRRVAPDEEAEEKADFESIRRKDRKADISVYQLRKKWDFGDYAVNGVDFAAYRGEQAYQLSGGMKRKEWIRRLENKSVKFWTNSKPTGLFMLSSILIVFRSILLTTHYMDDADRLSDRILIMVKGRVVCNGTPEFLKKRFGTGFLLTISLANGSMHAEQKAQRILGIAQQLVPEAKFSGSPAAQFTINLPYESKIKFAQLFTVLETRGQELDIDSFGLSVNTLEQVFIKVGEKAEGESNEELRARIVKNANVVRQGDPCFIFLLIRRGQTGTEVQFDFKGGVHYHDLSDIPRSKVFVDQMFHDQISSLFSSIKQCSIVQGTATEQNNFDIPPPSIGFYNNNGLSSFSINRFFSDGYFLAMSAYSNMLFGKNSPNTITMGIRGNYTADMISGIIGPLFTNLLNSAFACFGLTFGMAMLLAEVVTERITKFKHQIRLTGCRASTYWFSQMSTDFCYFLVLAIFVFSMSLVATKIYFSCATAVLPIFLMYFVAASLASYVLSFLFESATKGTVFVLAFHTIIPLVTFVLCIIGLGILSVIARIDFLEHKESSTSPSVFNIVQPAAHGFSDDDPDVRAERQAMDGTSDQALALSCRGLYKFYGAKCALQNLTFGIRSGECFGLLGINGAVDTTPAIGYCPQFDALSGFLTAADTLRLFGRLNGFRDVENRMQMILECVMLEDHANKIVKKCSGGQKRRIAVALMSGAECLLLDEPTAGVDPATRRQIWDLLTAVRLQGKAILLTTHSMEECEALCTRIGFLRDGRLQGIGTSQHLKNRYGNSYNLTFILDHVPHDVAAVVDAAVQQRFGVPPTTDAYQLAILSWNIPRRPDFKWSQMYMAVEKLISNIHQTNPGAIRDFFLIQDSLEQVFTRLATNEDASRVVVMQPPVYSATPVQEIPLSTDPPVSTPNHRISVISAQPWVLPSQQTSELNSRHLNGNPDFTKL